MRITIDTDEPCDGSLPVTRSEFRALEIKMAKAIDELTQLKADFDAANARVAEDTAAFKAALADLQARFDELAAQVGETSPEVQALVDEIRVGLVNLDPDPSNPPAPEPEPAP